MKKIIALAVAAALSIGLILSAGITVGSSAADISFREEILCGDNEYADGLSVSLCAQSGGYLFWSTVYRAGTAGSADTEFAYLREGTDDSAYYAYYSSGAFGSGLSIDVTAPLGVYFSGDFTLEDLMYEFPWEIVSGAADVVGAGEIAVSQAYLDDYYEYFPLCVSMTYNEDTDQGETVWLYGDEDAEYEMFNAYFQIPVPDAFEVEIEIEKDDAGTVTAVGAAKTGSDASPVSVYADAGTCGYIAFAGEEDDLDYSRLEGGFGIYRISYEMTELYEDESGEPSRDISIAGIEPVCSLSGTGIEVLSLLYSEGADELFVLGKKDGDLTVLSVDVSGGTLLGETTVAEGTGLEELFGSWEIENGMVLEVSSGLVVLTVDNQTGELSSLYIPLDEEELSSYIDCAEYMSFLYCEGRLAYAYTNMDDGNADFYLMILDGEGVVYHSCISCSIDTGFGSVYTGESTLTSLAISGSF